MAVPFISELNREVSVYRMGKQADGKGDKRETPVLVFSTRAKEQSDTGTEVVTEKIQHNVSAVFVIRKRNMSDLFPPEKLQLWETIGDYTRKFEITHVSRLERTHLQIHCRLYE